jgi:hypothetical protein
MSATLAAIGASGRAIAASASAKGSARRSATGLEIGINVETPK